MGVKFVYKRVKITLYQCAWKFYLFCRMYSYVEKYCESTCGGVHTVLQRQASRHHNVFCHNAQLTRDWSRVRKWDRVGTRELLGPTGTGTVNFHREQKVGSCWQPSVRRPEYPAISPRVRKNPNKMSQKRSSALRFRAGIALKGPERFRAGTELEGPEPVPCSRHGSDTGS